jgi:mono/diheme cytochrome c family protein
MKILFLKSLVSLLFFLTALLSLWSMLEIAGKEKKYIELSTLRRIHQLSGVLYIILFLGLSLVCLSFLIPSSGELAFRGLLHSLLAVEIFFVLLVKIAILRRYRNFFKYVQGMGFLLFFLSISLFALSGGYFLLVYGANPAASTLLKVTAPAGEVKSELVQKGARVFSEYCVYCHEFSSKETKVGPGLKGIFKKPTLPSSGRPATSENIIYQLNNPGKMMPSFKEKLSEDQIIELLEYLKTL